MNFKAKIICLIISIILVSIGTVSSTNINNKIIKTKIDDAELPTWNEGNYWKYDMDFTFITRNEKGKVQLNIDAEITDMKATLTDIEKISGIDNYVLTLDGGITGDVSLLDKFDVASLDGDFSGNAYIGVNTLAINKFTFNVDGKVDIPVFGIRDINFDMEMGFHPNFDFLDFPIKQGEPKWVVDIEEAYLSANVYIDILGGFTKDYTKSISFMDNMTINRIDAITLPQAGTFDCFVVEGDWGKTSELFYAPDAGFLVKVYEILDWNNGEIESTFDLELLETNYDSSNHPPEKPSITDGPTNGEEDIEYTFKASTQDPDSDQIKYKFNFGDGTETEWIGPLNSGEKCEVIHSYENKGTYNIVVKAKDTNDLESAESDPYTIMIYGNPNINVTINKIRFRDELDVLSEMEWYYRVNVNEKEVFNHNTDNGKYDGCWNQENTWHPNKNHEFEIEEREVLIKIKVMDFDGITELGSDDLADVSGSNHPDNDGRDDSTKDKRGAIYHGIYDIVDKELKPYSENPDDNRDKVKISDGPGMYITSGDYAPDLSKDFEGGPIPDPENDARVWFSITTDYENPVADIDISYKNGKIRSNSVINFKGSVVNGAPDYSWGWDFGNGETSIQQNPEHSYKNPGSYNVKLTVTDRYGQTDTHIETIEVYQNKKPTNLKIDGPAKGKKGEEQTYLFSATEPDNDKMYYKIEWGDGTNTEWLGPYLTGAEITKKKTWNDRGNYELKFIVKDEFNSESSKTIDVSMPKEKYNSKNVLKEFFYDIFENLNFKYLFLFL